jgi:thioredoxin reductase
MAKSTGVGPDGVAPPHSSGIKVIIVGLGFAGVVAAVECYRKGHDVIVFEQASAMTTAGRPSMKNIESFRGFHRHNS